MFMCLTCLLILSEQTMIKETVTFNKGEKVNINFNFKKLKSTETPGEGYKFLANCAKKEEESPKAFYYKKTLSFTNEETNKTYFFEDPSEIKLVYKIALGKEYALQGILTEDTRVDYSQMPKEYRQEEYIDFKANTKLFLPIEIIYNEYKLETCEMIFDEKNNYANPAEFLGIIIYIAEIKDDNNEILPQPLPYLKENDFKISDIVIFGESVSKETVDNEDIAFQATLMEPITLEFEYNKQYKDKKTTVYVCKMINIIEGYAATGSKRLIIVISVVIIIVIILSCSIGAYIYLKKKQQKNLQQNIDSGVKGDI